MIRRTLAYFDHLPLLLLWTNMSVWFYPFAYGYNSRRNIGLSTPVVPVPSEFGVIIPKLSLVECKLGPLINPRFLLKSLYLQIFKALGSLLVEYSAASRAQHDL